MKTTPAFFALLLLAPIRALAHDFWIEPTTYGPRTNQQVMFTLRVGENFMGDAIPRMPSHVRSFTATQGPAVMRVGGQPNATPAGAASFVRQGPAIVTYESNATVAKLDLAKFKQYLREEGLEVRGAKINLSGRRDVRDAFTRHAKTLLAIDSAKVEDRRIGMTFELVATSELKSALRAKRLPLRVYFRGQPLQDALVVAVHRRNPARKLTGRTNAKGEVVLPLSQAGAWLIKSVHLTPAADRKIADVESFWASLTLELR